MLQKGVRKYRTISEENISQELRIKNTDEARNYFHEKQRKKKKIDE